MRISLFRENPTYAYLASLSRYQKESLLEVLREDRIRTARAKGLSEVKAFFPVEKLREIDKINTYLLMNI